MPVQILKGILALFSPGLLNRTNYRLVVGRFRVAERLRHYFTQKINSLKLHIKNMVCIRCKMLVKAELSKLGLHCNSVELGEAEIDGDITAIQLDRLKESLLHSGLELLDDKKKVLIQRIKSIIVELVHYSEEPLVLKFSEYLSQKLHYDYTYMANLFSESQGTTIERFIIHHKIERVKELLVYNQLNLTEIAYQMHYSSVAHLSTQFKKVTGLSPSHFKQLRNKKLNMLDDVK